MSRVLIWPGGEHAFALRLQELEALQQITGEGPGASLNRLYLSINAASPMLGSWKIADVMDVVRLGLIGGGMDGPSAASTVRIAIERYGLTSLVATASEILMAALEDRYDTPGEMMGAPTPDENGISGK